MPVALVKRLVKQASLKPFTHQEAAITTSTDKIRIVIAELGARKSIPNAKAVSATRARTQSINSSFHTFFIRLPPIKKLRGKSPATTSNYQKEYRYDRYTA